jgi:hypothetical protein
MLELSGVLLFATNLALAFILGRSAFAAKGVREPVAAS